MSRVNRLTNVPWHLEVLKKDDDKRHRSRCVYYNKEDKHCRYHIESCRGSSHCEYYKEYDPGEERDETKIKKFHQKRKGTLRNKDLAKNKLAKEQRTSVPNQNKNKQKRDTDKGFSSAANSILKSKY